MINKMDFHQTAIKLEIRPLLRTCRVYIFLNSLSNKKIQITIITKKNVIEMLGKEDGKPIDKKTINIENQIIGYNIIPASMNALQYCLDNQPYISFVVRLTEDQNQFEQNLYNRILGMSTTFSENSMENLFSSPSQFIFRCAQCRSIVSKEPVLIQLENKENIDKSFDMSDMFCCLGHNGSINHEEQCSSTDCTRLRYDSVTGYRLLDLKHLHSTDLFHNTVSKNNAQIVHCGKCYAFLAKVVSDRGTSVEFWNDSVHIYSHDYEAKYTEFNFCETKSTFLRLLQKAIENCLLPTIILTLYCDHVEKENIVKTTVLTITDYRQNLQIIELMTDGKCISSNYVTIIYSGIQQHSINQLDSSAVRLSQRSFYETIKLILQHSEYTDLPQDNVIARIPI